MNDLKSRVCEVLGEFSPDQHLDEKISFHVETEFYNQGVVTKEILIRVDKDDNVPAYILQPLKYTKKMPGVLCLHQTTTDRKTGAREAAGIQGISNYYYALELARLGFVTIAPDYPFFGNYNISTKKIYDQYGYQSISMKAIVNHMAAISVLQALPNVNPERIGCIGHSLGGTNTIFSSFFDQRIKAAVISAGFTTFKRYAETSKSGDLSNWSSKDKYMPNVRIKFDNDYSKMPFDFPELLASLKPKPTFVSVPINDEIFDYSGAIQCIEYALKQYKSSNHSDRFKFVNPVAKHDFPVSARKVAYKFLQRRLNSNGH